MICARRTLIAIVLPGNFLKIYRHIKVPIYFNLQYFFRYLKPVLCLRSDESIVTHLCTCGNTSPPVQFLPCDDQSTDETTTTTAAATSTAEYGKDQSTNISSVIRMFALVLGAAIGILGGYISGKVRFNS